MKDLTNQNHEISGQDKERPTIIEVTDSATRSAICNDILTALPSWFGNDEAIVDYTKKVSDMPFYGCYVSGKAVGFVAIKVHNSYTAEVCVMGVLEQYHRMGIGRMLIDGCVNYCCVHGHEFLTVKTLDGSRASKSYERTRLFYYSMGFRPLEVFTEIWDADNPCLFMVRSIDNVSVIPLTEEHTLN